MLLKCNLVQIARGIPEKLSYEHLKVFAGLNQVSAGLNLMCGRNRFLPAETQPCTVRSVIWSSVAVYMTFMSLQAAGLTETFVTQ